MGAFLRSLSDRFCLRNDRRSHWLGGRLGRLRHWLEGLDLRSEHYRFSGGLGLDGFVGAFGRLCNGRGWNRLLPRR